MHIYRVQRTLSLCATLAFALALAGCDRKPPEPPPPPPPTPQEIASKIVADLKLNQPLPAPGSTLQPGAGRTFLNAVTAARNQNSGTPDGTDALQIVSRRISQRLLALEKEKLWEHVLIYCTAHVILNPKSLRFNHTREKAIIEYKKPRVSIEGFFHDGRTDQTTVLISFYLPIEKLTYQEKVRVGEEFYGLKMIGIVGKNHGVTMEYMATGEESDTLFNTTDR